MVSSVSSIAKLEASDSPASASAQRKYAAQRVTAVLLLAASPASLAFAQGASQPLPPLSVEAQKKKKAKQAPAAAAPAPQPVPQQATAGQAAAGSVGQPSDSYKVDQGSSPKLTAPLLDTPQTVTVIPGAIIQERNATNLTEVLQNTPGISFNAGENAFSSGTNNFQIRGFDTSASIFIDGARDSGSYARDTFNVDRVEVFKGPAADNGRGSAGGYVNIVTKTPMLGNFVRGESSLGFDEYSSEMRKRATVDVNQRVGTTAIRLNGMIEDGGVAGRDVAEANAWGLAPSIAFGLGTSVRAIFSYEHLQRNDLPEWGVPAHMMKGMFRYNRVAARANRDNFYGLYTDFDDVRGDSALARFEVDLSPSFTLSNQTRWSQTDRLSRFTFPNGFTPVGAANGTVPTVQQFYDRVNDSLTNQTNLSGTFFTGALKHSISTGIEFTQEQSDANRQAQVANPGGQTNIFNPNPGRSPGLPLNPTERNGISIDTVAGYFYDTIDITRHWQLTGGIRAEQYSVSIDSRTVAGAPLPGNGYEDTETTLAGKIGIVFKPVKDGSLYASYGVSALPPGSFLSNPDISRTGENAFPGFVPGADPVEMHNYEVGIKWDFFGGRLSTTAAAFHTIKANVPYNGAVGFPPIVYGEQIVQGIELGIAGNLTPRWKMFGGLLVLDSYRDHGRGVDAAARGDYGNDATADPAWNAAHPGGVTTTDGDELAFTPKLSASLWTTYKVTDALTLGGGVQYVGESWLGRPDDALRIIPNGKFGKLPDHFVVNLMASYELTKNVDLRFNVDNVFDETYAVSTNWPGQRALLGPPRTYRIGTAFKF